MASVREILLQSGLSDYEVNSLDTRAVDGFSAVLSKAESDRVSVDDFWKNVYSPGIAVWESERGDFSRKIAAAEARNAAYERERQVLVEQGTVTADSFAPPRNAGGQFQTPGTPQFTGDPSEFVGRVTQGLAQLSDVEYRYKNLYNAPLPIAPSQIIAEADKAGISPMEYANRQWKFPEKERQKYEGEIRKDEREKVQLETNNKFAGSDGRINPMSGNTPGMSVKRAALDAGQLKDPTRISQQERRAQTLAGIHKHIEEREQRDV
jgi:hypothetical protein